jgi:hypothetical protein
MIIIAIFVVSAIVGYFTIENLVRRQERAELIRSRIDNA